MAQDERPAPMRHASSSLKRSGEGAECDREENREEDAPGGGRRYGLGRRHDRNSARAAVSRSNEKPRDGAANRRADDISGRRAAGSGSSRKA